MDVPDQAYAFSDLHTSPPLPDKAKATTTHPSPGNAAPSPSSSVVELRQLWRRGSVKPSSTEGLGDATSIEDGPPDVSAESSASIPRHRGRMTEDEKVEKHRMIVRRSYYQKKELKHKLRTEIAALEERYQQLVGNAAQLQLFHGGQHHHTSTSGSDTSDSETHSGSTQSIPHCVACAQVQRLRLQYKELSILKEGLLRQRDALDDQLHDRQHFQTKLGQLIERDLQPDSLPSHLTPALSPGDAAITVQTPEFPVSFQPLREEECFAIIRRSVQEFRSQSSCPDFRDVGTHPIMGWNRKRTFGARANFSLRKQFPTQDARNLWNKTWHLYTETRLFEQLYSGAVNMKFHILQRVNDNSVLFCRTLKTEKLKVRNVTIFLFARFQHEGKLFILFRSIDKDRVSVAADHPEDAVLGMFSWLSFSDHTSPLSSSSSAEGSVATHCEVEFGGTVPSAAVADTEFWMMEFLSYLMRLENRAIGPVFQVLH